MGGVAVALLDTYLISLIDICSTQLTCVHVEKVTEHQCYNPNALFWVGNNIEIKYN